MFKIVKKSDLDKFDNWSGTFWNLNINDSELNDKELELISIFFSKIKKDFGISSSLKAKIEQYLKSKEGSFSSSERLQMLVVLNNSLKESLILKDYEISILENKLFKLKSL